MDTGDVMARVRRLEVTSRRLVRDRLAGEYGSVFKGRGVELADVREYIAGDDVRTIDWRVTARMDAAYVRRYVEERELTVLFVVDRSASATFGSQLRSKATLAADVCGVLGLAAARNHDRVGAVWFTDRVEQYVAPGKGRRHVLRVIRELMAFEPAGSGTDLAQALAYVNRVTTRRAVVFIVSDWIAAGYERELDVTARRHDTIAVQLVDPRERELPDIGLAAVADPETGRWSYLDTASAVVRAAYQDRGVSFDATVRSALRRRGIDHIRLETGRDYVAPLLAFFRRRERRRMH
jgi:uncharacterized protein (DUF58 family)